MSLGSRQTMMLLLLRLLLLLRDSWCHAEVYAAARSKPAFRQV